MRVIRFWGLALGATLAGLRTAAAQTASPVDSIVPLTLEQRLEQLDQEVRILKRLRELAADSAAAAAKERPTVTASTKEGFGLRSADGKYQLRFRGYVQTDGRFFVDDAVAPVANTVFLRRARPILEATVGKYFEFRVMPDFANGQAVLFDGYWDGKFDPAFAVRAGKFKPPVGLERLQSATDIVFVERALPTNLVPSRDIGLQISGDVNQGLFAYQVGVFDGVPDLGNGDGDVGDAKDFVGRIFLQPFRTGALRGLGLGIAGTTGIERGSLSAPALAAYRTPGQQTFFRYLSDGTAPNTVVADGRRSRLAPQAYFYSGPFGLLGEYTRAWQDVTRAATTAKLAHVGWQATGSFVLTGEAASFKGVQPKRPFDPKARGFGAVELAARYSELRIDEDAFPLYANPASAAQRAKAWAVGVNWYFIRGVRLAVDYEHTTFTGGAATGDREPENFFVTRIQHSF